MRNALFVGLVLLAIAELLSGCSSAPPPTSTPVIPPAPTTVSLGISLLPSGALPPTPVLPTTAPTATPAPPTAVQPTVAPTVVPTTAVPPTEPPTATAAATTKPGAGTPTKGTTPTVANTKTATSVPPTRAPSATPVAVASPTVAAGMYVTNLRISPDPALRGADLSFFATFQTDSPQNISWFVYIYRADTPNKPASNTARAQASLAPGTSEQQANGTWQLKLGGPCEYFFARAAYMDYENKPVLFTTPDGKVFEKGFTICPP